MEPREITWRVRATPKGDMFPYGLPEMKVPAHYSVYEQRVMRDLRMVIEEAPPGSEQRKDAMNCVDTIHELKALLGAEILEDGVVPEA